ncbi:MAG: transposase [Ginsengibacter sp.]
MPDYHIPLIPNQIYHIFNRAIGDEKLFREDKNYLFFLQKYKQHILPVADTFAYSLLPNHFHFLIRIKDEIQIAALFRSSKKKEAELELLSGFIMERFGNLFNSYAKSFNKEYSRKGNLFMDTMKRVEVENDAQFGSEVFYVHKNPVHHHYCKKIEDWKWSSYHSLLSNLDTLLLRKEVIEWFGSREKFIEFHRQPIFLKNNVEE